MSDHLRILLVEDNPGDADLIREMLPITEQTGFSVHCVTRLSEAVSHLKREETDLALLDLDLPDSHGIETVRQAHQAAPEMPIVVLTGNQDDNIGIAAVQGGAQDFLVKGETNSSHLTRVLRYAVQRQYAKEKVQESERLLRSTLNALSAHIAIVDATGKIITTNKAWRTFALESQGHVLRCNENDNYLDACRTQQCIDDPQSGCAKALANGICDVLEERKNQFELEYAINTPSGKRWFHGRVTPFPSSRDKKVVVSHEEITDRKQAQEEKIRLSAQLRHTYKMEAIGTLAGGIAHDFNNILACVLGYVELSLLEQKQDSQIKQNLQEIHRAALRAKELVQQILTFARRDESHIQPTRISSIAKEASKLIRSTIPTSIDVRLSIKSEAYAMADPTQIHQILINLLTNAAQAMENDGGVLTIRISEAILKPTFDSMHSDFKPGNFLKITVSDTGVGILPDKIEKIFDPYFTTKGRSEGSGLGLSVVHGIIRNHGGEITVESKLGRGTTFTIYLPLSKQKGSPRVSVSDKLPMGSERILFVDDERPIAEMSRQRLSLLGYQVTAVNSSPQALRLLSSAPEKFDLIITDMTMPQMSGEQLAMKAQKIKPGIPIILCTGYSKKISKKNAAAVGIQAFLMKPVSIRQMAQTIRHVLAPSASASHETSGHKHSSGAPTPAKGKVHRKHPSKNHQSTT